MEISERHKNEPRMEPSLFHRMRAMMVIIEGEMDEVIEEYERKPTGAKEKEWHDLKKVILSICDDYIPSINVQNTEPNVQEDNHVAEVRDDHVVPNHDVNQKASKGSYWTEVKGMV